MTATTLRTRHGSEAVLVHPRGNIPSHRWRIADQRGASSLYLFIVMQVSLGLYGFAASRLLLFLVLNFPRRVGAPRLPSL